MKSKLLLAAGITLSLSAFAQTNSHNLTVERTSSMPTFHVIVISRSVQAINYFVAQRYVDALQNIASAPNQKLIFMPLEAAGVIGAIGGVAELAKQALAQQASVPPPTSRPGPWERES